MPGFKLDCGPVECIPNRFGTAAEMTSEERFHDGAECQAVFLSDKTMAVISEGRISDGYGTLRASTICPDSCGFTRTSFPAAICFEFLGSLAVCLSLMVVAFGGRNGEESMDYRKTFFVDPAEKLRLRKLDPSYKGDHESEEAAKQ